MDNNNILFTKNATTGAITAVGGINGNTIISTPNKLSTLGDTSIVSPATGQGLIYNSTNQKWENKNLNLSSLNDCNFSSPQSGDFIKWDGTTSKFINRQLQYANLNITGKINNSLFPSILGVPLIAVDNYTSTTAYDTFENGLSFNQTNGLILGMVLNRTYLITAKINLSPTGTSGGSMSLLIGLQTGGAYTSGSSSTYYFNNSNSQLCASVSHIVNLTTSPDGIMVKIVYNQTYVGITPDDCNVVITIREL